MRVANLPAPPLGGVLFSNLHEDSIMNQTNQIPRTVTEAFIQARVRLEQTNYCSESLDEYRTCAQDLTEHSVLEIAEVATFLSDASSGLTPDELHPPSVTAVAHVVHNLAVLAHIGIEGIHEAEHFTKGARNEGS